MPRVPNDKRPTRKGSYSLLTDEVQQAFLTNLRTGVPIVVAGRAAGIADRTINEWLSIGRRCEGENPDTLSDHQRACVAFSQAAEAVYQEVHLLLAGRVVQASGKDWRAATWMLQRRHPDHWNRVEQVEISGRGGGPIEVAQVEQEVLALLEVEALEAPHGNGEHAD